MVHAILNYLRLSSSNQHPFRMYLFGIARITVNRSRQKCFRSWYPVKLSASLTMYLKNHEKDGPSPRSVSVARTCLSARLSPERTLIFTRGL